MKLYELSAEYAALREWLESGEGDDTAVQERLAAVQGEAKDKIEALGILSQEARRESEAYAAEIARLQERKRTADNRRESLLRYLRIEMPRLGLDNVKGRVSVRIQEGRESVGAVDMARVSGEWLTQPEPVARKADIMAHYRATGEIPDGVEIVRGEPSVVVR